MKRFTLFVLLLLASPSFAADNAVIVTPGSGVTMKSKDVGSGVQAMQPIISDSTGTAVGTASNPLVVTGPAAAGTAATGVVTVQGIAGMTKLLVTPDSVALPANQSTNISQINAVTPLMGNGVTGTGSQRVTIASDNTAFSVNAAATENHIGEVGGNILPITNAMTTSNATVTTGQAIGGLQTLAGMARVSGSLGAGGTSGYIQSVVVTFTDAVAGTQADIFFFDANPTGSTCTNAAAFVLADADRGKVIGVAQAVTLIPGNAAAMLQYIGPPLPYGLASATSAYACVVARASFAITSTANATLKVITLRN